MVRYVADEENLKLMMNLLKDQSRSIQFEAFHVFKVSMLEKAVLICFDLILVYIMQSAEQCHDKLIKIMVMFDGFPRAHARMQTF